MLALVEDLTGTGKLMGCTRLQSNLVWLLQLDAISNPNHFKYVEVALANYVIIIKWLLRSALFEKGR